MSVWSNEALIELADKFVPCTDEVWRLQRGTDAECRFFQKMADEGHYRAKGGTRQGIYVCTPSGKLLGSINSLNPNEVAVMLRESLSKWSTVADGDRRLPDGTSLTPDHRWEQSCPKNGLILKSSVRDLPVDGDASAKRCDRWNRDFVWFTPEEAKGFVPTNPEIGRVIEVPPLIVERLARFHIVDNVHGQTLPFAAREVRGSTLKSEVVGRNGAKVDVRMTGTSVAQSGRRWNMGESDWKPRDYPPHGISTEILGFATYDLEHNRFDRFEMIALGKRWGYTENNRRHKEQAPSPIGFHFELEEQAEKRPIAPTYIDVYNADWVKRPGVATMIRR